MNGNRNLRLIKAFTLTELLVVMLIAGIIISGIMEGFSLVHRIILDRQAKITENMDVYDAYHHLENVITNSDSVAVDENNNLNFYRESDYQSSLYRENSFLTVKLANITDTVLKNVSSLKLIKSELPYISDTVAIDITYRDTSNTCWKFIIPVAVEKTFAHIMEEKEENCIYE
ncbi:MAG: type II secretion system GspH family protein [Prevotellaceae bacterium]|jgi:prepilin-type N-terminal cleavage/methylation domain-containing protein|nr:type II secretion system GspH family protein [Prevotellaceae bacterium]